jgi:uncharacterized protein YaiI (UPF0178 family)
MMYFLKIQYSTLMAIWIDGDACPKTIKEIIFRAAIRTKQTCYLVANQFILMPQSPYLKRVLVEQGFDKADDAIEERVCPKDLVITSDLPLAEACLNKKAQVLSPRGECYSVETIKQKLAMRDFNEVMRSSGLHSGGPKQLSQREINQFANQLDKFLAKG